MRKIGDFLSENVGSRNVLKCSGYLERWMEKNLVVLKHDNHTPKSDGSQAEARPTNAKIIILFSFLFMDLNHDVSDASWVPNERENFRLLYVPRVVGL